MEARVACGECHRSQLDSACCRVGLPRRRTRTRRCSAGVPYDGPDRISALPDDMLLEVLARLGCARAAARTGHLSRRWRGLWTRTPELTFHNTAPEPLSAALAQVARPAGSLKIDSPRHHRLSSAAISEMLSALASLAPADLHVKIWEEMSSSGNAADTIKLPRFDRTASITMNFDPYLPRRLTLLPPDEGFVALESLSLCGCDIDLGDLFPRCPRLRKLRILSWQFDSLTVHSKSLEELDLYARVQLQRMDISAPALKTLMFTAGDGFDDKYTLTLSAPLVDNLSWRCYCRSTSDRFGVMWFMWTQVILKLNTPNPVGRIYPWDNILWLNIAAKDNLEGVARSFEQEMSRIPVRNISGLALELATKGHVYGAMLLDLLGLCSSVQKLQVTLNQYDQQVVKTCPVDCPCDQPNNWRSQTISLTDLKEVTIEGSKGEEHEVGLLNVLLRCAAVLETVTINFTGYVQQSCGAYMELPSIIKAHPSVKFKIYNPHDDQVLFG